MEKSKPTLADVRVIRWRDVQALTGKTRYWVNTATQSGAFPQPILLGPRVYRWREREILDWLDSRSEEPPRRVTAETHRCPLDYWL